MMTFQPMESYVFSSFLLLLPAIVGYQFHSFVTGTGLDTNQL